MRDRFNHKEYSGILGAFLHGVPQIGLKREIERVGYYSKRGTLDVPMNNLMARGANQHTTLLTASWEVN